MWRRLNAFTDWVRQRLGRAPVSAAHLRITWNEHSFTLSAPPPVASPPVVIPWSEIAEVVGFKRDCYTFDVVCVAFGRQNGPAIEIQEDWPDWQPFVEALPQYLPGCLSPGDWYLEIIAPAFETKPTVLYRRTSD